jgi:NADH-quinone oxidoreductase subunit M
MLALLGAFEPAAGLSRSLYLTFMVIGGLGTVLTAAYFLLMLSRVTHGRGTETIHAPVLAAVGGGTGPSQVVVGAGNARMRDVTSYELAAWVPLVGLILLFGLWPKALLSLTDPVVHTLLGAP